MSKKISVTVWNEFRHELHNDEVKKIYPKGMHVVIADFLKRNADMSVRTATLDEQEHGLTKEVCDATDVMIWWGHMAHNEVTEAIVQRVKTRVLEGMGLIVLHSGHYSKIFQALMGTTCSLKWREAAEKERLWNIMPGHPITQGIGDYFELPDTEMYGERFVIPAPDELIFISWFEGGEVFRSGCTWNRGNGKVFYFRPGHETFPIYYNPAVQTIVTNAVRWGAATVRIPDNCPNFKSLEKIQEKKIDYSNVPFKVQGRIVKSA